jgi:hypothetical protein
MGADSKPRLLQDDGSFAPLPAGRRFLELPDQTLGFLRELVLAKDSWKEYLAEEIQLANELPQDLKDELLAAIPEAYDAAIEKYKVHLPSYQMLPNSLGRLSEPTSVPYVRAFLNVFFPDVAKEAGISIVEPSDGDCVQCEAEAVISILSIAIGAGDWSRQQFCHERLFQLAIFAAGKKAAAEHVESVCSELYAQLEVQQ